MAEATILAAIPHGGELALVDSDGIAIRSLVVRSQLPRRRSGALMLMSVAVHDLLFWGAVALCSVAQLFILKAVFFPAPVPVDGPAADGRAAGRLRPASRPLEMAWVILPAIGLAMVFWWAWNTRHPESLRGGAMSAQRTVVVGGAALSEQLATVTRANTVNEQRS